MPAVTAISTQVGVYSTISPSGEGMKPGITSPILFSTQIARNSVAQAGIRKRALRRTGWNVSATVARTFRAIAVLIYGTRALCSPIPKKRYLALMLWCVGK